MEQGIHYKKEVIGIDTEKREVLFSDGSGIQYTYLVSSLPLNQMPGLVKGTPTDVADAATRLAYSKVSIVSIGFHRPDAAKHLWMYVYDKDILAARINSPSIKSPANAPEGCSSLQFEIYHGAGDAVSKERILENTCYAIKKMGFAEEGDILFMDYRLLPYGNVIFYKGMEKDREIVRAYMRKRGIRMIGRFGEWDEGGRTRRSFR